MTTTKKKIFNELSELLSGVAEVFFVPAGKNGPCCYEIVANEGHNLYDDNCKAYNQVETVAKKYGLDYDEDGGSRIVLY